MAGFHTYLGCPPGVWVLRVWRPDGWFDLYSFTLEPRHHGDYDVYNYYTSTNPDSPFVKGVAVLKTERDLRRSLIGRQFTTTYPDGSIERRELAGFELIGVLRSAFGIDLDPEEQTRLRSIYDPDLEEDWDGERS